MKINNVVLLVSIVSFYYLFNQFVELLFAKNFTGIHFCAFYHDFINI